MVLPPVPIRRPEISPANVSQIQQQRMFTPHSGTISDVCFNLGGDALALACFDHVELFATGNGNSLGSINVGWGSASSACFHPTGQQLAVCGGSAGRLTVWDVASRTRIQEVTTQLAGNASGYQPDRVAFSRSGNTLITSGFDTRVVLWDWNNGHPTPRQIFDGRGTYTSAIRCSADGLWLAAAYDDGHFEIWRMSFDGAPEVQPGSVELATPATDVSFNHAASRIAVTAYDGFARLLELPTGTQIAQLGVPPPNGGQAFSVSLAPRQPLLALAQSQMTPSNLLQFYDTTTFAMVWSVDFECERVMFDPSGRRLLIVTFGGNNQATLWGP